MVKYNKDGKSLRKYCSEKGIDYYNVLKRMKKRNETLEEALKNIKPHFKRDGLSLPKYCKANGISYFSILNRMYLKYETAEEALAHLKPRKKK